MVRIARRRAGGPSPPARFGRRALAVLCCAVPTAIAIGIAAGPSGGHGSRASAAPLEALPCAGAGSAVARPAAVPAAVLPPQTVLTSVARPGPGITLVTGVIPLQFRSAVDFYVTTFRDAGYVNGAGDAEMDEAEALFTGPGVHGKWKVNGILGCPEAVRLSLFVRT